MSMDSYINAEFVDVYIIYDLANGNGRTVVLLHKERYLTRQQTNHHTCILWTEFPVSVYSRLQLQPEDLKQLSIVY
ncbi:hypothetical protein TNCV_2667971 [Trichonephila clavipes]|nr:hypothetical protein TNCV_2667971 [Trichonephila clavipes]